MCATLARGLAQELAACLLPHHAVSADAPGLVSTGATVNQDTHKKAISVGICLHIVKHIARDAYIVLGVFIWDTDLLVLSTILLDPPTHPPYPDFDKPLFPMTREYAYVVMYT